MEQPESSAGKGPLLRRAQCRMPSQDEGYVEGRQRQAALRSTRTEQMIEMHLCRGCLALKGLS